MAVGQVSRPVAPVIEHLPQYHVGPGGNVVIEDGIHPSLRHIPELTQAGIPPGGVGRGIEPGCELPFIFRALNQNFRFRPGLHPDLHTGADMETPGSLGKHILSADLGGDAATEKNSLAGKQKNGCLLPFPAKYALLSPLHAVDPDIHEHIPILIVISGQDLLSPAVKFRVSKYLSHIAFLPFTLWPPFRQTAPFPP